MKSLILVFLILTSANLFAQWTSDLTLNTPICNHTLDQATAAAAYPSYSKYCSLKTDDGVIFCWQDKRNGDYDIYIQKFNRLGMPEWDTDGVLVYSASGDQRNPFLCTDGNNGAIIAWSDNNGTTNSIYARKVLSNGTFAWPSIPVIQSTSYTFGQPNICTDDNGGAIVVWNDSRSGISHIYSQRINASGAPQWSADGITLCNARHYESNPVNGQSSPTVCRDGGGGGIVAWVDARSTMYKKDIYACQITYGGSVLGTYNGVKLCGSSNDQTSPSIAYDNAGGAYVVWNDYQTGRQYDIIANRYYSGIAQWGGGKAIANSAGDEMWPCIAANGANGAFFAWWDWSASDTNIECNYFNIDGTQPTGWTSYGTRLTLYNGNQSLPNVDCDGVGNAYFAWEDERDVANKNIYMQKVNVDGTVQWAVNGIPMCTNSAFQTNANVVLTNDQIICFWTDYRNGDMADRDIYMQAVTPDGTYPVTEIMPVSTTETYEYTDAMVAVDFNFLPEPVNLDVMMSPEYPTGTGDAETLPVHWHIEPEDTGFAGFNVTLTLSYGAYLEAGIREEALNVYFNDGSGWRIYSDITRDPVHHRLIVNNLTHFSDWGIGTAGSTLPVELASFTGVATTDGNILLQWQTFSETDLQGFHLYRNTVNDFADAVKITAEPMAAHNASNGGTYEFTDVEITENGTYFYWLEGLNLDGTTDLHGPLSLYYLLNNGTQEPNPSGPTTTTLMGNYPNPFNPETQIQYFLTNDQAIHLTIYNAKGMKVWDVEQQGQRGFNNILWKGKDNRGNAVASGIYYAKMISYNYQHVIKLMLMK